MDSSPKRGLRPVPGIVGPDEAEDVSLPEASPPSSALEDHPEGRKPLGLEREAAVAQAKAATRSRMREITRLALAYGRRHWPQREPSSSPPSAAEAPPRFAGRLGTVLPYMRAVPWVLAALFALSFVWDFSGVNGTVFGRRFVFDGLLRICAVSGLIGFATNWLAITMLFQPREKRAILPQGLIPAQRERVIYRLSEAISRELINEEIIQQKIQESGIITRYRDLLVGTVRGVVEDPGFRDDLKHLSAEYVREVLGKESVRKELAQIVVRKLEEQSNQNLGGVALRLYRTFAEEDFQRRIDRALSELPEAVVPLLDRLDLALDRIPPRLEHHADDLEAAATRAVLSFVESFDVRQMIIEKARDFDEGQLESLLKSTSNEQLNYIKYLGGLLGIVGGLVIWEPLVSLGVLTLLALTLWSVDEGLVRLRRSS